MKPATSLPWSLMIGANGHFNFITNMLGHNDPLAHIECHNNTRKGRERDCLYTLHACNAYPRLVEALRGARKTLEFTGGDERGTLQFAEIVGIDKLLRELEPAPPVSKQPLSDFGRPDHDQTTHGGRLKAGS